MTRATEGDVTVDILTYMPSEEVVNAILAAIAWYGKAERDISR